ncbi:MAG: hypothetical protein R3E04_05925 [Sphingobium sp.]
MTAFHRSSAAGIIALINLAFPQVARPAEEGPAPAKGIVMAGIDFMLPQRMDMAGVPWSANREKQGPALEVTRFRFRHVNPPTGAIAPDVALTAYRQRMSFLPLPSSDTPVSSVRHLHAAATIERKIVPGVTGSFAWHIARLGNYNGTVRADGSKAYRHKASDYFLPDLMVRADLTPRLWVKAGHREHMRANIDTAIFGPRSMPDTGARAHSNLDFERSVSDQAVIGWQPRADLAFTVTLQDSAYRDRLIADNRGLFHMVEGRSSATRIRSDIGWQVDGSTQLNAHFSHEVIEPGEGPSVSREAWALVLAKSAHDRRLSLSVGRQHAARMSGNAGLPYRPQWVAEASAERPLILGAGWPDMRLRMTARSGPHIDDGDSWAVTSRDLQPQIRLSIGTSW